MQPVGGGRRSPARPDSGYQSGRSDSVAVISQDGRNRFADAPWRSRGGRRDACSGILNTSADDDPLHGDVVAEVGQSKE